MKPTVVVLDYGVGNIHSACRALERCGAEVTLTADEDAAINADGLLVPGVGAFGTVMERLTRVGGERIIAQRIQSGKSVLGICVGMQVLFDLSREKGEFTGLGLLSGTVDRLPARRLPNIGWAKVHQPASSTLFKGIDSGFFYFVHSYAVPESPIEARFSSIVDTRITTSFHEVSFTAAVEAGPLCATQFHPEKSGEAGLILLSNWISSTVA